MADQTTLNEASAWREIAADLAERDAGDGFLCNEVDDRVRHGSWSRALGEGMAARIERHLDGEYVAYPGRGHDDIDEDRGARILAALWLALEAEDELAGNNGGTNQ